jgi:hypothetical protein
MNDRFEVVAGYTIPTEILDRFRATACAVVVGTTVMLDQRRQVRRPLNAELAALARG